jgi:putative transposase
MLPELGFFDPGAETETHTATLPHWMQAGVVCFVTWRTWDSLPQNWAAEWLADRTRWLRRHNIDPDGARWHEALERLPEVDRTEFRRTFSGRLEARLDDCAGSCPFRTPELSALVATSLHHGGPDHTVLDFVVMPNHVHLLATFAGLEALLARCASWKRFTGTALNRRLGRSGRFWQPESFDHLVRSEARLLAFRRYIADNPVRAKLSPGEYVHYSRPLVASGSDG